MTQEELDALMADDSGELEELEEVPVEEAPKSNKQNTIDDTAAILAADVDLNVHKGGAAKETKESDDSGWSPPPPTSDHKMVQQLDDVTRDSEEKATQVLDMLDGINTLLMDGEEGANNVKEVLSSNIEVFEKLSAKFSQISTFSEQKEKCEQALNDVDGILTKFQDGQNDIMNIMDMMQYQDIHRQKIERVINVMRALAKYMNSLFASNIDDKSRAPSAVHLDGDKTENLMSDDDIESLINSLGKK